MLNTLEMFEGRYVVKDEDFHKMLTEGRKNFNSCFFPSVDFVYMNGKGLSFENCVFQDAVIKFTDFSECNFKNSSFHSCAVSNSMFEKAQFEETYFLNCSIDMCSLKTASLIRSTLDKSWFRMCNLTEADLTCATFRRSRVKKLYAATPISGLGTIIYDCPGATREEFEKYKQETSSYLAVV